jgi:hypothetical protein
MESLSSIANNFSSRLGSGRHLNKYTTEQLAQIEQTFAQFDVNDLLAQKASDDGTTQSQILNYLKGTNESKFVIHMTSA